MAKRKRTVAAAEPERPPESPRFSVHFHAEADSPHELHRKMRRAFGAADDAQPVKHDFQSGKSGERHKRRLRRGGRRNRRAMNR